MPKSKREVIDLPSLKAGDSVLWLKRTDMGLLQDGKWVEQAFANSNGGYIRKESSLRSWVTQDGTAGPSGKAGFRAEAGRYHLYVSLACPWAHRTLVIRARKKLLDIISVSVVHWLIADQGWTFAKGPGVIPDPIHGAEFLHQVYTAAVPDFSGRVTVPILWDKQAGVIVSNESSEIMRMFGDAFDQVGAAPGDSYPEDRRSEIDAINERIYDSINNGVYKAGFATTQEAYETAVVPLFEALDWVEGRLSHSRYLIGDTITEADWRLFTTLVRFDAVYFGHFKCNLRRISDYQYLSAYLRDLYHQDGVAETVDMGHIKQHYYGSHRAINPTGVVPLGPQLGF